MTDRTEATGSSRGAFITFEGGEGAGKSTQIRRLAARLSECQPRNVLTTREPGGTAKAEDIREAVLAGAGKAYGPFAEALLFSAARIDHCDTLIRPALARGDVVLCDRFADSTRAYQGAAGGLDPSLLRILERVVVGPTRPDLTLILDLDPEAGLARARARAIATAIADARTGEGGEADRFEAEAIGFHERLRGAFLEIAQAEPDRCAVIDAGPDSDTVEAAIRTVVSARLPFLFGQVPSDKPGSEARSDAA